MNIQRTSISQAQNVANTSQQSSQPSFTQTVAQLGHQCLRALSSSAQAVVNWCCSPFSLEEQLDAWVSKLHPYEQGMGTDLARSLLVTPRNSEVLNIAVKTRINPPDIIDVIAEHVGSTP